MKKVRLAEYFRLSEAAGILYEFVCFGGMLLCGYLMSAVLEDAMAARWDRMYRMGGLTACALFCAAISRYAAVIWRSRAQLTDTQQFRQFLYTRVIQKTVQAEDRGEMNVRVNQDGKTVSAYFQETLPKAIGGGAVMVCSALLICFTDWRVGIVFFALNLIQLLPIFVYEKWSRQIYNQTHSDEETYSAWMQEGYSGIRTLKLYGMEGWYMNRYRALNQTIIRSGKKAEKAGTVELVIFLAIDSLLNYGSYLIIGLFVLFGGLPMEKTPLLIVLAGYLFSSISSVYDLRLQQFDYEEAVKRLGFRVNAPLLRGTDFVLKAEKISKAYGEKQVLSSVALTVSKAERVLLLGENGSGKSTLLKILTGLETADSGEVILGIPQTEIAVSLQEEPTLSISARVLAEGMAKAGSVNWDALCRHMLGFHIQDVIDMPLEKLSPGQRRKFYLAAALAHPSKLMILDEPTNHLDQESIGYLTNVLYNYTGALIVCTHAQGLPWTFDKTLSLEGGAICGA